MINPLIYEIPTIIICLLGSAFFSGIEMGVISANPLRLTHLARTGSKRAEVLEKYLNDPDRLLSTILVGNNIVNQVFATVTAVLFLRYWADVGMALAGVISTIVLLVLGEYLPKTLYSARPVTRSLPFARLLQVIEVILWPLSRLMVFMSSFVVGKDKEENTGAKMISREHLQWLAQNSSTSGQISSLESLMINRTLTLQSKTARDIMTPLSAVVSLTPASTLKDVATLTQTTNHNKFPLINNKLGTCHGVLYVQDVLARIAGNPGDRAIDFLREPYYLPPETRADDILPILRKNGQRMAIIKDNQDQILGILTLDTIIAGIVENLPKNTTGERAADKDAAIVFNAAGKEI